MKKITKVFATIAVILSFAFNSNGQIMFPGFLGSPDTVCNNFYTFPLSGYSNYDTGWQILWSTGDTTPSTYLSFDTAGIYVYWCTIIFNGQTISDTNWVKFIERPTAPFVTSISPLTNCTDSVTITVNPQPGFDFKWYKVDNLNLWQLITGANTNSYTATSTNTYLTKVFIPELPQCNLEVATVVTISGIPKPYMNDTTMCQTNGSPYTITDNVNNGNYTYNWIQGNDTINPNQIQDFTKIVTITNSNNCSINDTARIIVNPLPSPNFLNNLKTCGEYVTLKDLTNNANYNYVWMQNNSILSTADSLSVNYTGTFNVKTINQFGCSVNDTLNVLASEIVEVTGYNAIPNIPNNPKSFQFYALNVENATKYLWDFGDGTTSTLPNPTHIFSNSANTSLISLTVSNDSLTGDCGSKTISLDLDVSGTTSINDLNKDYSLNVYPNPTTNSINVKIGKGTITNVTVTDIVGKVVYSKNANESNLNIDLSSISSGIYIVKAKVKDGLNQGLVTFKIVKQ